MKKIWNFIDKCWGTFLAWFENKAFAFSFALVLAQLGFTFADPIEGIPVVNVYVLAWLIGSLTTAVLLFGTSIVKKTTYDWLSLLWGCIGSTIGLALVKLLLEHYA